MVDDNDLMKLRGQRIPAPDPAARMRALKASVAAFEAEKTAKPAQALAARPRLTERAWKLWSEIMQKKMIAAPALAGLVALPIAGYATFELIKTSPDLLATTGPAINGGKPDADQPAVTAEPGAPAWLPPVNPQVKPLEPAKPTETDESFTRSDLDKILQERLVTSLKAKREQVPGQPAPQAELGGSKNTAESTGIADNRVDAEERSLGDALAAKESGGGNLFLAPSEPMAAMPASPDAGRVMTTLPRGRAGTAGEKLYAPKPSAGLMPSDVQPQPEENRDRIEDFKSNPVKSALEEPVSTFSIDVDTASYSFVRRSLKEGLLPQADTVRVEEMINYFPYDWRGPATAETPFNSTVSVMPTPWNANTKLMHVAIKGFDVTAGAAAEGQPRLPDRRVRLDGRTRQAAAAAFGLPHAGHQATAGRHGLHRHLCRQCRHGARTRPRLPIATRSCKPSTTLRLAARRLARPASARPIGWRSNLSSRTASTA
jgi:Ca-activated chloride channel family protein